MPRNVQLQETGVCKHTQCECSTYFGWILPARMVLSLVVLDEISTMITPPLYADELFDRISAIRQQLQSSIYEFF